MFFISKTTFFSINVSTSLIIVYMTQLFSMLQQRVDVVLSLITFLYTLSIVHFYIRMSISIYDKFYSNFITLYGYITSYQLCTLPLIIFVIQAKLQTHNRHGGYPLFQRFSGGSSISLFYCKYIFLLTNMHFKIYLCK